MNHLHGSILAGKKRLHEINAEEREAILNPIIGRSRAERLLDHSLKTLQQNHPTQRPASKRLKTESHEKKRISRPPTQPQAEVDPLTLVQLLRTLHHRARFPRTIELIRRFFTVSSCGQGLIDTWRTVTGIGFQALSQRSAELKPHRTGPRETHSPREESPLTDKGREDVAKVRQRDPAAGDALEKHAWLVLAACWQLTASDHITDIGDCRLNVIAVFENLFKLGTESSSDIYEWPSESAILPADLAWLRLEINRDELTSAIEADAPCTLTLQKVAQEAPAKACERVKGSPPEQDFEQNKSGNTSSGKQAQAELRTEVVSRTADFLKKSEDWACLYQNLMPTIRLNALAHNWLYTDDSHVFHRALDFVMAVMESWPASGMESVPQITPADLSQEIDLERSPSSSTPFVWKIPNGMQLLSLQKTFFWRCLSTIFEFRTIPWARSSVFTTFQSLYTKRRTYFDEVEINQIESWRADLNRREIAQSGTAEPVAPGEAHVPIFDTRVEVLSAVDGQAAWAARQLTSEALR